MLNGGAIAWRSHLQLTVALSTREAEYLALTEETTELKGLRTFLAELGYKNHTNCEASVLHSDNQSAIAWQRTLSHMHAQNTSTSDITSFVKQFPVQYNIIWVQYIPTAEMTADSVTKGLSREKHEKCGRRMGMTISRSVGVILHRRRCMGYRSMDIMAWMGINSLKDITVPGK
jgi:hypothetical protein